MPDPIYLILAAILGGAFVACLVLPVVWKLAKIAARAIRQCEEYRAVLIPLLAEVIAYRRGEAAGEEDEIEQEEIEI